MKQEPLIKTILRRLKKRVSAKMLLILIVTLSANSFAWFIYANRVSSGVQATVKAWNITFEVDEGEITEYITIDVDELYPGKSFTKDITISNNGDTDADLSYEIKSVTLFGVTTTYTDADNANVATLIANIQQNYPFTITPTFSSSVLAAHGTATFNVSINWPYESGEDAKDTQWGANAYTYAQAHPNTPSLQMQLMIKATQKRVTTTTTTAP